MSEQEIEEPQEAVSEDVPDWSPEEEQEARDLGWKSPDEWKGDLPAGYIDNPKDFNEWQNRIPGVRMLKARLGEFETRFETEIQKVASVAAKAVEKERTRLQSKLDEVLAEQERAVEEGDTEAFRALRQKENSIRGELSEPKSDDVPADHKAAIDGWVSGKDWFRKDAVMTQAAVTLYGEAQSQGMTDPAKILQHVDARLKEEFPHKFGEKPKRTQPPVSEGLSLGARRAPDGYDSLPDTAVQGFKELVRKGVFQDTAEDRKEYAEMYNDQ